MRFSLVALSIAFASRQVAAAAIDPASISEDPTSIVSSIASITAFDGDKVPSSYILTLQDTVSKPSFIAQFRSSFPANSTDGPELTHTGWSVGTLNGLGVTTPPEYLEKIKALPGIKAIEEDGIMKTTVETKQTNAPWGLGRISQPQRLANQNPAALNFTYTFDSVAGAGSDVYIVDTGINTAHVEFGGRASLGAVFGSSVNADGNGHGTHVAGTVGGTTFGVSKKASLIAVKVLADDGSGSVSDIISGLNFVRNKAAQTGRPTVVNMSLGGGASAALDNAVRNLISAGIHVVLAAGNDGRDAANTSPAHVTQAITVAASTIADARASFSNFGNVVDIFAPGQQVISAWIGSTTATKSLSGTSMACPHVAGLVAYLISREGNRSPAAMSARLTALGVKGAVSGVPNGTPNVLARNDF